MSSQEAHVEQVYNEAMERGLMPEVTPTEDGHFTVKDSTDTQAKFTTRQQARNAASQVMTKAQQAEVAAMLAAAVDGRGSTVSPAPTAIPVEAAQSNPAPVHDQQRPEELDLARVYAEAQAQGFVPPIHQQDGKFIVTDSEGTPATFTNREEAVETAIVFMTPQQRQKVQAMVEQKQKAGVNNTAPVDQQTVTASAKRESSSHVEDTSGKADAVTAEPPPPPPARIRPPLTGDPQFGPKHPITGNKPTPPAEASFSQEALAIPEPEIQASIAAMKANGHAWDRHGPEVTDDQLGLRAMHKVDPISQTLEDGEKPGERHNAARHATQFTSERAMAQAQRAVENTSEFKTKLAHAMADPTKLYIRIDTVKLETAFGSNYKEHVGGKTRIGSSTRPAGVMDTDLTDGHIIALFKRDSSGKFKLHTMFPNPNTP